MDTSLKQRRSLKGKLTRLENTIRAPRTTMLDQRLVDRYKEQLEQHWQELNAIHNEIGQHCEDADFDHHQVQYDQVAARIEALQVQLPTTEQRSNEGAPVPQGSERNGNTVRLPRLELPTFSGNFHEWTSFYDLFTATIHGNEQLSGAQKLQYLKASMRGEAAVLLQSVQVTDNNFAEAWDILTKRYHNRREIINAHLKKLCSQPAITSESPTALRKLIDHTNETVRALRVLEVPVDYWDLILVHLVSERLDHDSRRQWELTLHTTDCASYSDFMEFLDVRARALISCTVPRTTRISATPHRSVPPVERRWTAKATYHVNANKETCPICTEQHPVYRCSELLQSSIDDRRRIIKENDLCFNCLFQGHLWRHCKSGACRKCGSKHHTLLHQPKTFTSGQQAANATNTTFQHGSTRYQREQPATDQPGSLRSEGEPTTRDGSSTSHHGSMRYEGEQPRCAGRLSNYPGNTRNGREHVTRQVLLATALVNIRDVHGDKQVCRALLDSGSQATFVSEDCVQRLGLPRQRTSVVVSGINAANVSVSKGAVNLRVSSRVQKSDDLMLSAIVLKKVTGIMPAVECNPSSWSHLPLFDLADPDYHRPNKIDVLFGADVLAEILQDELRRGPKGTPIAQSSLFGWIISGETNTTRETTKITVNTSQLDLVSAVQKFWELEEVPGTNTLSSEEINCEEHFTATHCREEDGRFVVRLPLKTQEVIMDGPATRIAAIQRLEQVERRLARHPQQQQEYCKFLEEYETMGHMERLSVKEASRPLLIYLPHHSVIKESSSTTRLRVVFDASARGRHGTSLNDHLMVGPTIQEDIINILLRFRTHAIAITADISKMYRQVKVNKLDTHLQNIVWRNTPSEPVQDFRLLTLTYGMSCAPFIATRCLQQLATSDGGDLPEAEAVTKTDFYVDDLLSGAETESDAINLCEQLTTLLSRGGFHLRKWASSSDAVLETRPSSQRDQALTHAIHADEKIKTLGLQWNPTSDYFCFQVTPQNQDTISSKRSVLSTMAKIYDPMGWLAPTTVKAKIILQQLWRTPCTWDERIPANIEPEWTQFQRELVMIEDLRIPRRLNQQTAERQELHGFCDASERAYAAVIYLKTHHPDGSTEVTLVAAKTRVAPIKAVTIPRLELCSALLLARLFTAVQAAFKTPIPVIQAWTDSTVTLAWINATSSRWKTFVANRVAKIQESVAAEHWRHVKGDENPADCASRGISPCDLKNHPLWWHGPLWLAKNIPQTNVNDLENDDICVQTEQRVSLITIINPISPLLLRYSSLSTLIRVSVYIFRFIRNCKSAVNDRTKGPPSSEELDRALRYWITVTQQQVFPEEIKCLKESTALPAGSRLISLNPFLDAAGLLRVGGRLRYAAITIDQKFPVLLPKKHALTDLIVRREHVRSLHAGPQLLLCTLQQRYWILGGRDVVRHHVQKCVICHRQQATIARPMMGSLPSARVNPSRPFMKCGVDYAGPLTLRAMKLRGQKSFKAYVAIFVCFVTHAVHIELVSNLTTDAFLAAFRRFVARRGHCKEMYSDQGTNFVGANRELKELQQTLRSTTHNNAVAQHLGETGTDWRFNPPGAPHFGGLWEAGVKSMKYHLRRVVGDVRLDFEEMTTVLSQVEACLNSRPLCQMTPRPEDLSALTPGHFLIGGPLTALPEPDYSTEKMSRLSRWQLVQRLSQHFWKRWNREYLSRLQQRPKAWTTQTEVKQNDLVLIKDDNLPPTNWRLGRIIQVHPGRDGVIRVVTIKTSSGELRRPVVKICRLPVDV